MIEERLLKEISVKYQTNVINILREYYQHLFLSKFYQQKGSEMYYFKGGTALRIVFGSPRYSEDLDFSTDSSFMVFERLIENVLIEINKEGVNNKIIESKKTSGGFFSIIEVLIYNEKIEIQIQASKRSISKFEGERKLIVSDFIPSYFLQIVKKQDLFNEKINAFINRRKIRDFFDLYFILRNQERIKYSTDSINKAGKIVRSYLGDFKELKIFLPKNFWPVIKDLKTNLITELESHSYLK